MDDEWVIDDDKAIDYNFFDLCVNQDNCYYIEDYY